MTTVPHVTPATVYLVGAGPGDPGLITLRAVECLGMADLVLYDYLVNPAVLEHASRTAELACLGRHGTGREISPDEIISRVVDEARNGRTVVRLKGGDPSIFARGADELGALREAGIPYEIVPGITTGLAAAAYCEIPITHHEDASAVAFVAGQERHCKATSGLDYGVLAEFPGTLVFYMGVKRASQWSRQLIEHGKPPETPVAIVRMCSWAQQQMIRCTLGAVTEVIAREGLCPPAVFVVGKVVDRAPQLSWLGARPLSSTRVLVPGSPGDYEKLGRRLAALGADVITQPAVRITDPSDWAPVDAALDRLDEYDWLLFSSASAVDYFFRRLFGRGGDARRLGQAKLAAVGPGTAEGLARYHLQADMAPEQFVNGSLARSLLGEAKRERFLFVRARYNRHVLAEELEEAGARVEQIVVCTSIDVDAPSRDVARALSAGQIDWITVTSSAAGQLLARLYGDNLRMARLASISPLTSTALRDLGYEPAAEASEGTTAGLLDAILCAGPSRAGQRDG